MKTFTKYLPEFVYGGIDGIVTTFAIIASAVGAELSTTIILILGFANLFADGFSMAASSYLARSSEIYGNADHSNAQKLPLPTAITTFIAFNVVGFIPLVFYILAPYFDFLKEHTFLVAIAGTAITFILIGFIKGYITGRSKFIASLQTLLIGGAASAIAYFVGAFLKNLA